AVFWKPVVLLQRASTPLAVFLEPVVFLESAPEPLAVFSSPEVLLASTCTPVAVLELPVVLLYSAWKPSAVLPLPLVLLKSENQPCAVLFDPVVLKLSASTFSAALLPLPRSSVGCFAWATGESTKHASTSRIVVNMVSRSFINLLSFDCLAFLFTKEFWPACCMKSTWPRQCRFTVETHNRPLIRHRYHRSVACDCAESTRLSTRRPFPI